jgi:hypothetical protein
VARRIHAVDQFLPVTNGGSGARLAAAASEPAAVIAKRQLMPPGSASSKANDYSFKRWMELTHFVNDGDDIGLAHPVW